MGGTIDPRLSIVSSYLNGVRIRQQRQMAEQQQLMQQQRIDEDIRQFDLQLKEAEQERAARLAHQKSQTDLQEKEYALTKAMARPKIIQGMQEGSISSEKHPIVNLERFNQLMSEGNHADAYELSLRDPELQKIFGDVSAPTPESAAIAQRKLLEPKVSANVDQHQRIAEAEQPFKLEQLGVQQQGRLAVEDLKNLRETNRQTFEASQRLLDRESRERIARRHDATRLTAASIAKEAGEDPQMIFDLAQGMADGKIKPSSVIGKPRLAAMAVLMKNGLMPIDPDELKDDRAQFAGAANTISQIEKINNKWGEKMGGFTGKFEAGVSRLTGVGDFADDLNRIKAFASSLATFFTGEGRRLSDQDSTRMAFLVNNFGADLKKNKDNVEELQEIASRYLNTKYGQAPPEQRARFLSFPEFPWFKISGLTKEKSSGKKVVGAEIIP